jgi:hypothetical protein
MPVLTFPKSSLGAIVNVTLQPSRAGKALLSTLGRPVAAPVVMSMLLDTGAESSVVDEDSIAQWQLPYARAGWASTLGGVRPIRSYELALSVCGRPTQVAWEIEPLLVAARPAFVHSPYSGLLGRDVLDRGLLIYNGHTSECTLAY